MWRTTEKSIPSSPTGGAARKQREQRASLKVGAWFRALEPNVSDSASFDNAFELKLLEGMSAEKACSRWCPCF